jgi:MinD-like ATPase involved in chromosome partitioning or flagellar assembly/Flp pilus assembly protein TadD
MKSITFYSYKGGVGRSLALSNIAIRLSELKKSVCVLDFDLEAPGLHYKFKNYNPSKKIETGIVDYISNFIEKTNTDASIKEHSLELIPHNTFSKKITLIPAGNISESDYWNKLSLINWSNLFYKEDGIGVRFFLDLKEKIKKEINPDFLLIDSRTGITDIAGITLRILADSIVILAANNNENKDGSIRIIKTLLNKENELFDKNPQINFVLTRVPFKNVREERWKEEKLVTELTKNFEKEFPKYKIPISIIHSDRRLEEDEQQLIGYEHEEGVVSIENDYLKLFDAICLENLSPEVIESFKNKKNAEKLYFKAQNEKDKNEKIKLLTKAIELYDNDTDFYELRGFENKEIGDLENALKDYSKALDINPTLVFSLINSGNILFKLNQFEKALVYFDKAILNDSKHEIAYLNKINTLDELGMEEEAFKLANYVIENINSENSSLLNTRANNYRNKKDFKNAYMDIYKAISINSNEAVYFGTLAEIYYEDEKMEEFYYNLTIALSKGIKESNMQSAKDIYSKLKDDVRFLELLKKYELNIDEIIN